MTAHPLWLTASLPGIGGTIKSVPEDFVVEELPAYAPSGEGEHVFVWVEKRDLTTFEAVRRVAAALGVRAEDVGTAGLKDRHAITRQQLSLPRPVTPERALSLDLPGLRVLSAARHGHKLKTGHLRGNRFAIRVRTPSVPPDEAAARANAILSALSRPPGVPNFYGEQRFGRAGDNAVRGRELLLGRARERDGRRRRLLLGAYQAELFNRYLEARIADGLYARVLPGDILRKTATGGLFATTDPHVDQVRLETGEVLPTGPMFGPEMRRPAPGTEAAAREEAILAAEGIGLEDFVRVGKLAAGTRRPIGVPLEGARARPCEEVPGAVVIEFTLPPGAYATVVLGEVRKVEALLDSIPEPP